MKLPVRRWLPLSLALLCVTLAAPACGPDFPNAIFVLQNGPGGDYARYAAGHLGVPQSGYLSRNLVIAYDYLSGHPLSASSQQQAIAVNAYLLNPWEADQPSNQPAPGFSSWVKVRKDFGPVDNAPPPIPATDRHVPGEDYDTFTNCLDDAFANAAKTLNTLVAAHTAKDPAVLDWVRGQDAVFTNCGDGKAPDYYGPPDKKPAPPPQPAPPAAAPANAPLWLRQDRAYQLAAASFYHLDLDDALTRFRAIAADTASPWSLTAHYLIARTYIRKASFSNGGTQRQQAAGGRDYDANLKLAQSELLAMQSDPRMAPMRHAVDSLLDYVNIRLQPDAQAAVLAARAQSPATPAQFKQALLDIAWLHSTRNDTSSDVPDLSSSEHPSEMLAFIDAMYNEDEPIALAHWRATPTTPWLLAAMSFAKPSDAATPDLLKAAGAIAPTDPGWTAITYQRLRLSPTDAATRQQVLALLPQIKQANDPSTTNLFLSLATATAPTLNDWLATAARVPAGDESDMDGEEATPLNPNLASTDDAVRQTPPPPVEDDCGKQYSANTVLPLFDTDAATVFNHDMPLRLLAQSAESTTLPEGLRFQVAQAAWARAVLLDQPAIARRMSPILVACRAAWKPVLDAYDAASDPTQRHALGLLALMRFASTIPDVWDGEDRRNGFATYDDFRQNWWCSTVPPPGQTVDMDPAVPATDNDGNPVKPAHVSPPPFLTASDLAEAHTQVAALEKIPRASTYFATQALAWQKAHPTDPHTPDILGEAFRVVRNSCRKDAGYDDKGNTIAVSPTDMTYTANLARTLFETIQSDYPHSAWAKRYTSWQ